MTSSKGLGALGSGRAATWGALAAAAGSGAPGWAWAMAASAPSRALTSTVRTGRNAGTGAAKAEEG